MILRKRSVFTTLVVAALLLAGWGPSEAQTPAPKPFSLELRFMTGPSGGAFYTLGTALAEIFQRELPGLSITILPGNSLANIAAMDADKADLGLSGSAAVATAVAGGAPFKSPVKKALHMATFWTQPWQLGVTASSGISSMGDLKGKRLAANARGSVGEQMTRHALQVYGLSYSDMARVEFIAGNDAVGAMKDRRLDAWPPTGPWPYNFFLDVANSIAMRFISLSDDKIAALNKINGAYVRQVIPADTYKGQDKEVVTFGDHAVLIVHANVPDEVVARMTRALAVPANLSKLRTVMASLKGLKLEEMKMASGFSQHAGAAQAYREVSSR